MDEIVIITPSFDNGGPRTIRISNILNELPGELQSKATILKYANTFSSLSKERNGLKVNNHFTKIHILFRFLGVYKLSGRFSRAAKKIGPLAMSNFLMKWDLLLRFRGRRKSGLRFVLVVSPFTNYLLVPWLRKTFKSSEIILDIGDPLYQNSGRDNSDNYSFEVEKKAINSVNKLIVTNEVTRKFFTETYGFSLENTFVVPQGVDLDLIEEGKKNSATVKPHTLAYAGRFYKGLRWPEALFAALRNQAKYELHLYGSNWTKTEENVVSHPKMLQAELFAEMCGKQILVFIDNDKGIQTSGKIYELLAFGKPLLFIKGSEESEASRLAAPYSYVFFAENNAESILAAIKSIDETHFSVEANAAEGFSWKTRAKEYEKALTL